MSDFRYVNLRGFTELTQMMKQISEKRQAKIFKASVQAGAVEMAKVIRSKAPQRTGRLRRSIKARQMPTGNNSLARSVVEVNAFDGWFVEKGWNVVKTNRYAPGIKRRFRAATPGPKKLPRGVIRANVLRRVAPRPFVRPGFHAGTSKVTDKIRVHLGNALFRELKKIGRY